MPTRLRSRAAMIALYGRPASPGSASCSRPPVPADREHVVAAAAAVGVEVVVVDAGRVGLGLVGAQPGALDELVGLPLREQMTQALERSDAVTILCRTRLFSSSQRRSVLFSPMFRTNTSRRRTISG